MLLAQQPLANEFWLASRNRPGGTPTPKPWLYGLGLATALLAEMLTAEPAWLWLRDGELWVNPSPDLPWDAIDPGLFEIAWVVRDEQQAQRRQGGRDPGASVKDVLEYLATPKDRDSPPLAAVLLEGQIDRQGNYVQQMFGDPETGHYRVMEKGRLSRSDPPLAQPAPVSRGFLRGTAFQHLPLSANYTGMPTAVINRSVQRGAVQRGDWDPQQAMLVGLLHLADITASADTVGTELWPSFDQLSRFLRRDLVELLHLADDVKSVEVLR